MPELTFLFTDIEGSTRLWERHPEAMRAALARHDACLREAIQRQGGVVFKTVGDAFHAAFEDAGAALQSAVEAQRLLLAIDWGIPTPLRVRMGLHTGEAEHRGGDYFGPALNRVARILGAGHGGQILLSAAALQAARGTLPEGASLLDLGERRLRDLSTPERILQLAAPGLLQEFPPLRTLDEIPITVPYLRNAHFVGREELIEEIEAVLQAPGPRPVALVGMGGAGKTQIALEYAHRHASEYPAGVFWLNARDALRLEEEYAALGRFFDVPDDLDTRERAVRVRDRLAQAAEPALLILDNLSTGVEPRLPAAGLCRILVTTRERSAVRAGMLIVEVPVLDPVEAVRLLQTHRPAADEAEWDAARQVAELLGHLPLAVALAAHHVDRLGLDFAGYRDRLARSRVGTLEQARRRFVTGTGHPGGVFDAIELSCRSLEPPAPAVLQAASFFAARAISPELLREACGAPDPLDFEEAVADLVDGSLVTREADGRLSLHELVRVHAREQMSVDELRATLRRVAGTLGARLAAANAAMEWREFRIELPHCRSAAEFGREHPPGAERLELLAGIGQYSLEHQDLASAARWLEEALGAAEALHGRESMPAARLLLLLAETAAKRREHGEARRLACEALEIASRRAGADAPELQEFHNTLGYVLKMQGCLDEALSHYRKALALAERSYGRRHPAAATCLNNLGTLLEAQGSLEEALAALGEALEIVKTEFGPRHVRVATRLNNIGRILARRGKPEEASAHHAEAVSIYEEAYGPANRHVAWSRLYLGDALAGAGDEHGALQQAREALAALESCGDAGSELGREVRERIRALERKQE